MRTLPSSLPVLLALVLTAALFAAPVALAQGRACDAPINCTPAECLVLQANVTAACKSPAPISCNSITGCSALKAMKSRWLACYAARNIINANCWAGGDPGHQQAAAQAIQNVATCDARIALPEPVGCADPCPFKKSTLLFSTILTELEASAEASLAAGEPAAEPKDPSREEER